MRIAAKANLPLRLILFFHRGKACVNMVLYALHYHVESHKVISAVEHDYIGKALCGLNKLLMHGLNRGEILVYNRFEIAPSLLHVAHDTAQYAHVGVGVDKNLYIKQLAKLGIVKYEDSLHYYYLRGLYLHSLVRTVVY